MGRSRTAAAGLGDNHEPLTDDDVAALQHYHARRVRTLQAEAAEAASVLKSKQKAVGNQFALLKGQTGILRKDFEELLALEELSEAEFELKEKARHKRMMLHGMPVGAQLDMFPVGDTADDMARAYADGKRAGLRADDPTVPSYIAAVCHQEWLRGWHDGQTENAQKLGRAEAILARIEEAEKAAKADAAAAGDAEVDEEAEEFDPEAEAKRLTKAGFTERGPVGADQELADA